MRNLAMLLCSLHWDFAKVDWMEKLIIRRTLKWFYSEKGEFFYWKDVEGFCDIPF